MKVNKTLELEGGSYEINATFSPDEANIIIEVGLSTLLRIGSLPIAAVQEEDLAKMMPYSGNEQ